MRAIQDAQDVTEYLPGDEGRRRHDIWSSIDAMSRDHWLPREGPRPGLVSPVRCDPEGVTGPTRSQVRSARWRRSSWGFWIGSDVDGDLPEQRIAEAAVRVPDGGAITGWAGLRWLGAAWLDGRARSGRMRPVTIASMRADTRPQPGIDVCAERLDPQEVVVADGVPVTVPARSVCFEMRYAPSLRAAVVYGDMAAYADLVSQAEVLAWVEAHPGWTGIDQARRATALMEENCWSPPESLMRLVWLMDAQLPTPWCNVPLFDRQNRHLATPDLLDPVAGVIGEYDGHHHLDLARRRKDVTREDAVRDAGLEYFTVLAGEPDDVVAAKMRSARARARFEDPATRSWTTTLPPWWSPVRTVDQRRARGLRPRR